MIVLKDSLDVSEYIEQIQTYNLDLINNQIYLFGEESYISPETNPNEPSNEPGVEFSMANRFMKNLQLCLHFNPKKTLIIQMKTCGGDWQEGIAIYDAIKAYPNPVVIVSETHARSMSSLILQAASVRYLLQNSVFMFHYGAYGDTGEAKTVWHTMKFHHNSSNSTMLDIYVASMLKGPKFQGWSNKKCRNLLKAKMNSKGDVYLTAQEALEWGFADKILESWQDLNMEVKSGKKG